MSIYPVFPLWNQGEAMNVSIYPVFPLWNQGEAINQSSLYLYKTAKYAEKWALFTKMICGKRLPKSFPALFLAVKPLYNEPFCQSLAKSSAKPFLVVNLSILIFEIFFF